MNEAQLIFKQQAQLLKTEDGVNYAEPGRDVIQLMLDRYCEAVDAGDQRQMNKYISGLMLRFWNKVGEMMKKNTGLPLDYDDYVSWLYEAIEYACKYRAWQDPTKNVNAQQAINMCVETIRKQHYYQFNLAKHRANYNAYSIDSQISDDDGAPTLGDALVDEDDLADREHFEADATAKAIIQACINDKKLVEAIILDTIAHNNVERTTKKTVEYKDADGSTKKRVQVYREFWPYRCVQILSSLPETYTDYFGNKYVVNPVEFDKALEVIRNANNQKIYRMLRKCLSTAQATIKV